MHRLAEGRDPIEESEELTADNRVAEEVYLSLRTLGGLTVSGPEIARVSAVGRFRVGSLGRGAIELC